MKKKKMLRACKRHGQLTIGLVNQQQENQRSWPISYEMAEGQCHPIVADAPGNGCTFDDFTSWARKKKKKKKNKMVGASEKR